MYTSVAKQSTQWPIFAPGIIHTIIAAHSVRLQARSARWHPGGSPMP